MNSPLPQVLEEILLYFPELSPPITLSEDVALSFSKHNRPLPQEIIAEKFNAWDTIDEFSEFVPCFSIPLEGPQYALVYWKGSLLSYEYILITLDKEATLISKKVIAGTISNGESIIRSVARIDEDNCIFTSVGDASISNKAFDPTENRAYRFEILPDGMIHSSQEELTTWEERKEENQS